MQRDPRRARQARRFFIVSLLMALGGLVACGPEETAAPDNTAVLPTLTPSPPHLVTVSPSPTLTPSPLPPVTETPPATPTPLPTVTVSPTHPVILSLPAAWLYAVAAPFATIPDEIRMADVQALWQAGELLLDEDTAVRLRIWWGEPDQPGVTVPADELVDALWAAQTSYTEPVLTIIPFHQLEPRLKVLRVDGVAPIDMDFDPAAYPLIIPLEPETADTGEPWPGEIGNWDDGRVTHIVMTGPAGMRRAVADRMDKYGIQYPGEETGPVLQMADIAHMSNENAFAPNCPPADPFDSDNVCNRDEYFELMTWMGIDINEMTGNHLNDWGTGALLHTFDLYEENGMQWFGGGRDLADAARPLLIEHNGNKIAFVGCNPVGPEYGWATETQPGALPCGDYSDMQAQISQLAADGYLVFATLQYLEDYQYAVLVEQRRAFNDLARAGAAAVSGSHAHFPQGFAFVDGAFIHYGLGNLLADQMWSLGSRQTFLDIYTVYDGRILHVDLWTGLNEDYARIRQMTPAERAELLTAVFAASFFP
ncbi:MAG: CapA family protein [Anaerolineae bacterium]|nr:CapA family protein [Anaerolineae bacterium]